MSFKKIKKQITLTDIGAAFFRIKEKKGKGYKPSFEEWKKEIEKIYE